MMRRFIGAVRRRVTDVRTAAREAGQTTAEYALVILGAAAIGTLVLTWATKSHVIGKLFDMVVSRILPG
jgi:hypothetical protein